MPNDLPVVQAAEVPMTLAQAVTGAWRVGDVTVVRLVERALSIDLSRVLPQATPEALAAVEWLWPHFASASGSTVMHIQCFLIKTRDRLILVDSGFGNHKNRPYNPGGHLLDLPFIANLAAHGWPATAIDTVVCTHLHADHAGGNTRLVHGQWRPTFANARYLVTSAELDYAADLAVDEGWNFTQRQTYEDSVQPLVAAGCLDEVEPDHRICDEVGLIPTSGHTAGHVSVLIESSGESGVVVGDVVHHPVQLAHPSWGLADFDSDRAAASRTALLDLLADRGSLAFGAHWSGPSAGIVRRERDAYRLDVVPPTFG